MRFLLLSLMIFMGHSLAAQLPAPDEINPKDIYLVEKNDGSKYLGQILRVNEQEVVLKTTELGNIAIPKHEIKSVKKVEPNERNKSGKYVGEVPFYSRHSFTPNALTMEPGEAYFGLNLFGPEVHFGVKGGFSLGIITSWVGVPLVGSMKWSTQVSEGFHLGIGGLVGTLSWIQPTGIGLLGYGMATIGNKRSNLTLSAGITHFGFEDVSVSGTPLFSLGGMAKMTDRLSFVGEAIAIPIDGEPLFFVTPMLRFQNKPDRAWQFGFAGAIYGTEATPIPFPTIKHFIGFR